MLTCSLDFVFASQLQDVFSIIRFFYFIFFCFLNICTAVLLAWKELSSFKELQEDFPLVTYYGFFNHFYFPYNYPSYYCRRVCVVFSYFHFESNKNVVISDEFLSFACSRIPIFTESMKSNGAFNSNCRSVLLGKCVFSELLLSYAITGSWKSVSGVINCMFHHAALIVSRYGPFIRLYRILGQSYSIFRLSSFSIHFTPYHPTSHISTLLLSHYS